MTKTDGSIAVASARTLTVKAIEEFKGRVTVGDVSSHSGLAIADARQELISLAEGAGGVLQVSEEGDIAYVFQPDFLEVWEKRQRRDRLKAIRIKIWQIFLFLLERSFGVILLVSILIAIAIIAMLIIASQMAHKEGGGTSRTQRRYSDGRRMSGGGFRLPGPIFWMGGNPFFGRRRRRFGQTQSRQRQMNQGRDRQQLPQDAASRRGGPLAGQQDGSSDGNLGFLEAVYSFLFGEGHPNGDLPERSRQAISQRIADNGGVLIAEEVLPYMVEPLAEENPDEDYVLPTLIQFDGLPEVSERGELVYRFPVLQRKGSEAEVLATTEYLRELPWVFSEASYRQSVLIGILGGVNFALWAVLEVMSPTVASILGLSTGLVASVFAVFVLYGFLFLLIPLVRWFTIKGRNQKLETRNQQRQAWGDRLQDPPQHLLRKLQFSRRFAQESVFQADESVYRTDKDLSAQEDSELNDPRFRSLGNVD